MLPHYEGKYEPKQKNNDFDSARQILMKEDDKMIVKRRFDRIFYMMQSKWYIKKRKILRKREIYLWIQTY